MTARPEVNEQFKKIQQAVTAITTSKLPRSAEGADAETFRNAQMKQAHDAIVSLRKHGSLGAEQASFAESMPREEIGEQEISQREELLKREASLHEIRAYSAAFVSETLQEFSKAPDPKKQAIINDLVKAVQGEGKSSELFNSETWKEFSQTDETSLKKLAEANLSDKAHLDKFCAFRALQALGVKVEGESVVASVQPTTEQIAALQTVLQKVELRTTYGIPARLSYLESLRVKVAGKSTKNKENPAAEPDLEVEPEQAPPQHHARKVRVVHQNQDAIPKLLEKVQAQRPVFGIPIAFKNGSWVTASEKGAIPAGAVIHSIDGAPVQTIEQMAFVVGHLPSDAKSHTIVITKPGETTNSTISIVQEGKAPNSYYLGGRFTVAGTKKDPAGIRVTDLFHPYKIKGNGLLLEKGDHILAMLLDGAEYNCDNLSELKDCFNRISKTSQPITLYIKKAKEDLAWTQAYYKERAITVSKEIFFGCPEMRGQDHTLVF